MCKSRILCFSLIAVILFTVVAYAAEENFFASTLTAEDVNCKKCHTDSPHLIHAPKPVECSDCHGEKRSVSIPQCTKCHNGPIHKVHEGKVNTQACSYCHKNIENFHNDLLESAVCSHCHTDLIDVHGQNMSCGKCHRSPPKIVKPVKSTGMVLVCETCHASTSVATIHGSNTEKKPCYNCHRGTSQLQDSDIPHIIHATIVDCKSCHAQNKNVFIPECTQCHNVDTLHAFNKIGQLTSDSELQCSKCHKDETKLSGLPVMTATPEVSTPLPTTTVETAVPQDTSPEETDVVESPGFLAFMAVVMFLAGYGLKRRI